MRQSDEFCFVGESVPNSNTVIPSDNGKMSSLQITEITGKDHKNVMRDIRNLLEQGVAALNFEPGTYLDANQQSRPCYNLTKKGCLILASGYDAKLRERIIDRWEELETKGQSASLIPNFSNPAEAARAWAEQYEARLNAEQSREQLRLTTETQVEQLKQQAPKVEYFDKVIDSTGLLTVNMVAACFGISTIKLNKLLCQWGIQYKQSSTYFLYAKYREKGYTEHKPYPYVDSKGETRTRQHMFWTEKGKQFIIDLYTRQAEAERARRTQPKEVATEQSKKEEAAV